jgi:hypothetical protein
MIVNYTEQAKRSGKDLALLEQATRRLEEINRRTEEIIGSSDNPVTAEWDATTNGNVKYKLKLRDSFGEVEAEFEPDELRRASYMNLMMRDVSSKLLAIQSDIVHKKVMEMVKQL